MGEQSLVVGGVLSPDQYLGTWGDLVVSTVLDDLAGRSFHLDSVGQCHRGGTQQPSGRNQKCDFDKTGSLNPVLGRTSCLVYHVHSRCGQLEDRLPVSEPVLVLLMLMWMCQYIDGLRLVTSVH